MNQKLYPTIPFSLLILIALLFNSSLWASSPKIIKRTYTYKKVGNLEIKADVYRLNDQIMRPVVVWIHGGALMIGHREWIDRRVKKNMLDAGYVFVSIDYRLAPETKLPEIIKDLEDAFQWIHKKGSTLYQADVSRLSVMGSSAGGYMTLTAGFRVKPRPKIIVSFYGYGDLVGDWYSTPSPHQRHQQLFMTREKVYNQVSGPPISDSRNRKGDGAAFYCYCRRQGIWPSEVSGWNLEKEIEKFYPYMAEKNVTPEYPPTVFIHGTKDTDVPYHLSVDMANLLKKEGVEHQLLTIQGAEHGLSGGNSKEIDQAYKTMFETVHRHLSQ